MIQNFCSLEELIIRNIKQSSEAAEERHGVITFLGFPSSCQNISSTVWPNQIQVMLAHILLLSPSEARSNSSLLLLYQRLELLK